MELFKIVTDKNELKKRCQEVEMPLDEETKTLLLKMIDYLKKSQDDEIAKKYDIRPGVGLAANQIGINKRFLAVYIIDDKGNEIKYDPRALRDLRRKMPLRKPRRTRIRSGESRGFRQFDEKAAEIMMELLGNC